MVGDSVRFMAPAAKNKETAMCGKEGEELMKIFIWTFFSLFFLSIDMPLTSTKTQLPMLITRNIKLSKLIFLLAQDTIQYYKHRHMKKIRQ